nr:Rz1 family lipoprotein [Escherichia coli]
MLKLKMMLCVMMSPPAWIMQPPPDWQTPLNGIISPSERG